MSAYQIGRSFEVERNSFRSVPTCKAIVGMERNEFRSTPGSPNGRLFGARLERLDQVAHLPDVVIQVGRADEK